MRNRAKEEYIIPYFNEREKYNIRYCRTVESEFEFKFFNLTLHHKEAPINDWTGEVYALPEERAKPWFDHYRMVVNNPENCLHEFYHWHWVLDGPYKQIVEIGGLKFQKINGWVVKPRSFWHQEEVVRTQFLVNDKSVDKTTYEAQLRAHLLKMLDEEEKDLIEKAYKAKEEEEKLPSHKISSEFRRRRESLKKRINLLNKKYG